LLTDNTSTTGLTITQGSGAPGSQKAFQVKASDGTVICEHDWTNWLFVNMKVGAAENVGSSFPPACLNGQQDPPCIEMPDQSSVGQRWWSGTGVPTSTTVGDGRVGDMYIRRDGGVGTYLYRCTADGSPGTWGAIA
jgi:hypothetical protein